MTTKRRILITGYGPFAGYDENPSSIVVEKLKNEILGTAHDDFIIDYEIISVKYEDALAVSRRLCSDEQLSFVVHVGVHPAKWINLETTAFGHGYITTDVCGSVPHLNCGDVSKIGTDLRNLPTKLTTVLDCNELLKDVAVKTQNNIQIKVSNDPGRYLCGYIYYNSLFHNNNRSIFVHIPEFDDVMTCAAISQIVTNIVLFILKRIS